MRKIGIVGGVAWRSTVAYYEGICARCERLHRERRADGPAPMPEFSIESLDLATAVSYLGTVGNERSWRRFDAYHRAALRQLEAAGVDFALIASNTPHHRLDAITTGVRLPVVGIFHATARACADLGARRALILGTSTTMGSRRLVQVFRASGIDAGGPPEKRVGSEVERVIADLQERRDEGAADRIHGLVRMALGGPPPSGCVVCLACTELPLAFPSGRDLPTFEVRGVRYVNSTAAHVDAAFRLATAGDRGGVIS